MVGIKHAYSSTISDSGTAGIVKPSHWNADHTIEDASIAEAKLVMSDNTTANASISAHGFLPKLPNDSAQYLNGVGTWTTVESGGADILEIQVFS
jgi:hypothetical protein